MNRWRFLFALAGLGLSITLARASDPPLGEPGQIFYPHTQIVPPPVTPPTQAGPPFYTPPNYPTLPVATETSRPVRVWMQKCGIGCWSHLSSVGCGSLRADWEFVFGSCRTFFGEPCQHGPQRVPPGEPMPPPNLAPWGILNPAPYPVAAHVPVTTAPGVSPAIPVPPGLIP
jgi:hypothetical protein